MNIYNNIVGIIPASMIGILAMNFCSCFLRHFYLHSRPLAFVSLFTNECYSYPILIKPKKASHSEYKAIFAVIKESVLALA